MSKTAYDVVIVGSGLGGLLCGAILSKYDHKVCVVEKHQQIGGNLQTFERKGIKFNSAIHFVGGLDKGQILYQIYNHLNILDKIEIEKLDDSCYEKIFIGNSEYSNTNGIDAYKDHLLSYFPEEKSAIEAYVRKIEEIWNSINILNLREFLDINDQDTDYTYENAFNFIENLTSNKELKALFGITNCLYAGIPEKSPFLTHAIIAYHYIQSAYKFYGGSDKLAYALEQVIVNKGGEVKRNKEVVRFIFDDKKVIGVELKNGQKIEGKAFISNIHPSRTLKLVEPGRFRKAYIRRLEGLENTIGSFCLYIILKKNQFKNINSNVYISTSYDVWNTSNYDEKRWPTGCILYTTTDKDNPEFAESMVVASFMKYEEVSAWKETIIEKRGPDYKAFKKLKAEALLKLVETKFPDIQKTIDEYYSATPLTFRDYTGNPEGSLYGVLKDCNNPRSSFISSNTRVPNLFLTGQNTGVGLHGVLGVTISALFTCTNFMDINLLLRNIRNE